MGVGFMWGMGRVYGWWSSYYTAYTLLDKVIILMGKKEVEKRKMYLQIMLLVLVLGETSINSISSIGLIVLALASFLEQ